MTTNNTPETKQFYLDNMRALYHKKTNNSVLLDRQEYNMKLERLIELENPMEKKLSTDSRLIKMCLVKVQEDDGAITTKLCKRGTNMPYVPIEDLFDIIHNAHIKLNHAGRNGLQRYFRDRYANITKDCIMSYLNTCIDCPRTKRASHLIGMRRQDNPTFSFAALARSAKRFTLADLEELEDEDSELNDKLDLSISTNLVKAEIDSSPTNDYNSFNPSANASIISTTPLTIPLIKVENSEVKNSTNCFKRSLEKQSLDLSNNDERFTRGQVDVFNMEAEPDNGYKFIMRYTNILTEEVRLCALRSSTPSEIADALVNIYCEQGAPVILQSINGRELTEQIINEVVKIWPQCRQLHAFTQFHSEESAMTSAESDIIERLLYVMKRTSSCSWSRSLRFLQWELNTTVNSESGKAHIENSLGYIPTIGLKSSKLIDAIYDKARSEEEIMEYLQDAELLRSSTFSQQICSTPVKRSRIALQHVDDALNGKMTNFATNESIYNSSACNSFATTTNDILDNNLQSQSSNSNLLSSLNKNYYISNIKSEKFRQILAQHQRNNVNNFVQRISERFHQNQNLNNNNNKEKSFNSLFTNSEKSSSDPEKNIYDYYTNISDKTDASEHLNSSKEIELFSTSNIKVEINKNNDLENDMFS